MKRWTVLGLGMLAACATLSSPTPCASFGPGAQFCLLAPAALPATDAVHLVSVTRDGDEQSFIGQLHVDAGSIHLVTSSLLGPSLFSIDYDGRRIVTQPADGPWHADLLLASLQLALARQEDLQAALHGLSLRQQDETGGYRRDLMRGEQAVAHVEVHGVAPAQTIRIDIPPARISVTLAPLDTPTPP